MEKLITNSDLEPAALVPHEATQLAAVPEARLAAPFLGLDKNLTRFIVEASFVLQETVL